MTVPRILEPGDTLPLLNNEFELIHYVLVGYCDHVATLLDEATGDKRSIHEVDLTRMLHGSRSFIASEKEVRMPTLAETMQLVDREERVLAPHLQELLTGESPIGGAPRARYALSIPLAARLQTKVEDLKEHGIYWSSETIERRFDRFCEGGVGNLVDRRRSGLRRSGIRTDPRVMGPLLELIGSYVGKSTATYTAMHAELEWKLKKLYPVEGEGPRPPSLSTVMRLVRAIAGDQNPVDLAKRRQTNALIPRRRFDPRLVAAPGDECQIDHTEFDVLVRMPDGTVGRPHLTILLDKASRSIIAHAFTVGHPTGYDHALLLADALVPRRARTWSSYYDEFGLPDMPWADQLSEDEKLSADSNRPYIVPRSITTDNGADFLSDTFMTARGRYGINIVEAPPKSATSKGHVERHFGDINTLFAQHLPCYVGGDVLHRGEKAAKEAPLDLREVSELFDRWVALVWQNRFHEGLFEQRTQTKRTPNMVYAASVELTGHFVVPFNEDDYIALMPSTLRTVQNAGVTLGKNRYDSDELVPLRRRKDGEKKSVRVIVHYDPNDQYQVWVQSPKDHKWITCKWVGQRGRRRPLNDELMLRADQLSRDWKGFTNHEADMLTLEMRDGVMQIAAERDRAAIAAAKASDRDARRRVKREKTRAPVLELPPGDEEFVELRVL